MCPDGAKATRVRRRSTTRPTYTRDNYIGLDVIAIRLSSDTPDAPNHPSPSDTPAATQPGVTERASSLKNKQHRTTQTLTSVGGKQGPVYLHTPDPPPLGGSCHVTHPPPFSMLLVKILNVLLAHNGLLHATFHNVALAFARQSGLHGLDPRFITKNPSFTVHNSRFMIEESKFIVHHSEPKIQCDLQSQNM